MMYRKCLILGTLALTLISCGGSQPSESAPASTTAHTDVTAAAAPATTAKPEATPEPKVEAEPQNEADSFYDDIDFDWRGNVSHERYDDYGYDQLMSDAEIDKIIADSKRKYYHEKKVEKLLQKESDTFTQADYKETIEELKYISVFDVLWARAELEIENMKYTGKMGADDYNKPNTKCQKEYQKAAKFVNQSIFEISGNVSRLLSILKYADLDLENKKAFYEAKKLRAYFGKVIEVNNDLYEKRKGEN